MAAMTIAADSTIENQRIQRLPEQLANQIAAGEVVERPASVLKELMENAIDAGASSIDVEVEKGGMRLIRVRDNGCGIPVEDLPLAIQRHATSKIRTLEQLHNVQSMGFRGEALASIGSVSRLQLTSRTAESDMAWTVQAEGSEETGAAAPSAFPVGSLLEVAELFYNTPVRRRFLRSEQTEYHHLEEVFKRMALSRMDVAMRLKHNQRPVFQLPQAEGREEQERRIAKLCGRGFMQSALYIDFEHGPYRLHGWIGHAGYSRSQADVQYCFLNQRAIRDKLVNHAIRQAYSDFIVDGRYAAFVLFMEMPMREVDVNVHPTKHEVRFHESRMVHDFLVATLRRALLSDRQLPIDSENRDAPEFLQATTTQVAEAAAREYLQPATEETPVATYTLLPGDVALIQEQGRSYLLHSQRLLHWHFVQQLSGRQHGPRPLLMPVRVSLSADTVEWVCDCLQHWDWDVSQVGPESILVRAMPDYLTVLDVAYFCRQLAALSTCPEQSLYAHLAATCCETSSPTFAEFILALFAQHGQWPEPIRRQCLRTLHGTELHGLFPGVDGE